MLPVSLFSPLSAGSTSTRPWDQLQGWSRCAPAGSQRDKGTVTLKMSLKEDSATGHMTHVVQVGARSSLAGAKASERCTHVYVLCLCDSMLSLMQAASCVSLTVWGSVCSQIGFAGHPWQWPFTLGCVCLLVQVFKATEEQRMDQHRMLLNVNHHGIILGVIQGKSAHSGHDWA